MSRSRRHTGVLTLASLTLSLLSTTAAAQGFPYRRPPPPPPPVGIRAFAVVDASSLAAASTFESVVGSSRMTGRGGGVEVTRLWRGVFARVAASSASAAGSRVGVFENVAVSLGIPLDVSLGHVEIGGGWRMEQPRSHVALYGGGGLLRVHYVESSSFADTLDDSDVTFGGYTAFGGVDARVWRWIMAGAEVQYRSVPDALGEGGVSKVFNESNLGGVTIRVMVGVRRY
jgi:hypothetical protein